MTEYVKGNVYAIAGVGMTYLGERLNDEGAVVDIFEVALPRTQTSATDAAEAPDAE